jgi:hypothetical protein
MTNPAAGEASDYNTQIITEFRANQGRVGGMWEGTTLILLHHVGARSGIERVTPVACSPQPGGRFAIWAANGGSPAHPNWYYNLKAAGDTGLISTSSAYPAIGLTKADGLLHGK